MIQAHGFRLRTFLAMLLVAVLALAVATTSLLLLQVEALRAASQRKGSSLAEVLAANLSAAVAFRDPESATELLTGLAGDPTIDAALVLVDDDDAVFAAWTRPGMEAVGPRPESWSLPATLVASHPVRLEDEQLGMLWLRFNDEAIDAQVRSQARVAAVVLLAVIVLAAASALWVQRLVTRPIRRLSSVAHRIAESDRRGIRAERTGVSELDVLVDAFNVMLDEVESRERRLAHLADSLEQRVQARTHDLQAALRRTEDEIAERTRIEEALRESRERAEAANEAKTQFLANMSHEIRTPMTAILGYAELLLEAGSDEDGRRDAARTIHRNGEHLLAIINDILDLSKIEAGRLELERLPVRLDDLLAEVRELMQVRADARGIALEVERDETLPECVLGDPIRLRQVLLNLVGNAVKFTESGAVRLRAASRDGRLAIDVEDTGIGIDADALAELFRPFAQADSSMSRRFGGTGLGLAISRRLAEAFDGSLEATSTPGAGSCFTLTLPLEAADGAEALPRSEAGGAATNPIASGGPRPLEGLDILLVEDGVDNQRLIGHLLRRAGATVAVASDGRAGLDAVAAAEADGRSPALVLMDMQMPVMDGYAAAAALRERGWSGPIVALTAHAMQGDRRRCLDAGCDEYLTKPVDRARLVAVCAELVRARRVA